MITIISGTNRKGSDTFQFAKYINDLAAEKTDDEIRLFSLTDLPKDFLHERMYEADGQSPNLKDIQNQIMIPADKFIFVIPEYNGGFPGILKLFIDACSVWRYKSTFKNKKAAIVGIATGRAGNLRGIDHLTGVLHHVGTTVMPIQLPISSIDNLVDNNRIPTDQKTLQTINQFIEDFIEF